MADKAAAARLKAARIAAKYKTAQEFAEKNGIGVSSYQTHEKGTRGFSRHATKYARLLNVNVNHLLTGSSDEFTPHSGVILAKRVGIVQAGVWREVVELAPEEQEMVAFPDPRLGYKNYTCLRVEGDSMNKVLQDGEDLLCITMEQFDRKDSLHSGLLVIVQRKQQDKYETTVKELELRGDEYWLWPRSDNPKHQAPMHWAPDKDYTGHEAGVNNGEVAITGVVVAKLTRFV